MTQRKRRRRKKHNVSALVLKLLAALFMFIDHAAASLRLAGKLPWLTLYQAFRAVGRIAFPMYGFMLTVGVMKTRSKLKYLCRILLLAVISEIPFNLALFGRLWWPNHQNVFITLFFGLLCVSTLNVGSRWEGKKKLLGWFLFLTVTAVSMILCKYVLRSDYQLAGIGMISIMGILTAPLTEIRRRIPDERFLRLILCALGIAFMYRFTNKGELYAFLALIPICLYNDRKGYSSELLKWAFYLFYPLHLTVLGIVLMLPRL